MLSFKAFAILGTLSPTGAAVGFEAQGFVGNISTNTFQVPS